MNDLEFNKIFAAILIAGIVAMIAGFVADQFVHPKMPKKDAVPIEGVEVVATEQKKEPKPEPVLGMIAQASVDKGEKLSRACATCHSLNKGGPHGIGPNLWNIVGHEKQAAEGYSYSGALDEGDLADQWTYAALNKFLWKPKWYAPGTKMNYIGMKKPEDRAAIIAWLRTLSDNPEPLPEQAEIEAEKAELAPEPEESPESEKSAEGEEQNGNTDKSNGEDGADSSSGKGSAKKVEQGTSAE